MICVLFHHSLLPTTNKSQCSNSTVTNNFWLQKYWSRCSRRVCRRARPKWTVGQLGIAAKAWVGNQQQWKGFSRAFDTLGQLPYRLNPTWLRWRTKICSYSHVLLIHPKSLFTHLFYFFILFTLRRLDNLYNKSEFKE